jgi:hypothetical protein
MLKRLSETSWGTIIALAVAWPLAWLLIPTGTIVVAFRGTAASDSGGLAAIGVTPLAAILLVGPPLVLLILRAVSHHVRLH